jgi:hypothetical protein
MPILPPVQGKMPPVRFLLSATQLKETAVWTQNNFCGRIGFSEKAAGTCDKLSAAGVAELADALDSKSNLKVF